MFPISSQQINQNFYTNPYSPYTPPYSSVYGLPSYTVVDDSQNSPEQAVKTLGLAALLQVISSGLEKGSEFLSNKISAGKEFTTGENVVKVARDMVGKNNLDVTVGFVDEANKNLFSSRFGLGKEIDAVAKGENAFFANKLKLAVAPKSKPSLILHELGHAINAKKGFTRLLQGTRRYAGYAPMALLLANGLIPNNRQNGKKNFIERNAGILGFCAFLPTIIEEAIASGRGIKAAKKVLNNPAGLKILKKNYALALGTYILAGIGLGVAAKQSFIYNGKE